MEETYSSQDTKSEVSHDIPKCTHCGNIGKFKTETILTPMHLIVGVALMIFWILPKPMSFVTGTVFMGFVMMPLPLRLIAAIFTIIVMFMPGMKSWAINTFLALFGIISGPMRWGIAMVVGVIYFGTVIIVRFNKKKRDNICTKCKARNQFTFNY